MFQYYWGLFSSINIIYLTMIKVLLTNFAISRVKKVQLRVDWLSKWFNLATFDEWV